MAAFPSHRAVAGLATAKVSRRMQTLAHGVQGVAAQEQESSPILPA